MDGPARNHRRLTSFPVHHRAPASPRTQTPSPGPAPPSRRLDHHLEHRLWNRFPGTRKMSGNTPTGPTYRPPFVLDNPKHRQYVRPCVGPVAQVVEQLTFNQWVTGSNPVGLTNQHIDLFILMSGFLSSEFLAWQTIEIVFSGRNPFACIRGFGEAGLEGPQGQVRSLADIQGECIRTLPLAWMFSNPYSSSGSCQNAKAFIYRRLKSVTRTDFRHSASRHISFRTASHSTGNDLRLTAFLHEQPLRKVY